MALKYCENPLNGALARTMRSRIKRKANSILPMQRFLWLVQRPIFWRLTIGVHGLILIAASLLYWLEMGINPRLQSFHDALYWAIATATTVGYGDVTVVTTMGQWLAMGLMILGTLFHALYTALFAAALMKPELDEIEREIINEEKKVDDLARRMDTMSEHNRTP